MLERAIRAFIAGLLLAAGVLGVSSSALAANCYIAAAQGATGPASWQTYCWIDFSTYNNTLATSAGGQNFSLTLQDGTVMNFTLQVSSPVPLVAAAAPSWSGAAVGNTAFLGIAGNPILYQSTFTGTSTITFSNISLIPPAGTTSATTYMLVAADGESTNGGESLTFTTNGGAWQQLDVAGPINGTAYPTISGLGTNTFTETGVGGNVGAYIVGSTSPTSSTATLSANYSLQGAMFAVRFASLRLNTQIVGARVAAADQFTYNVDSTVNGGILATATSSGTGLSGFNAAALSTSVGVPLTLTQAMAAGSTSTLSHYQSALGCTNNTAGSPTSLPSGVITTSYAMATLAYGDNVQCTFTETPFPHLQLTKALGASGREFAADQFVMNISQGATVLATTTTSGTGTTVTGGSTPQLQAAAGTTYTLAEVGAGATALGEYTSAMACTNANAASATALPTTNGGTIKPAMGDVVACVLTNNAVAANANLTITKTSAVVSDPVNGTTNPKAIPGAIVRYTFTVTNTGPTAVTANSVFIIDTLPSQISVGSAASPVFTQGTPSSGLTFAAANIKYSNAGTAPTSFAACTYTPVSNYDPAVRYVCLNPQGSFAGSTGTPPSFQLSINAQVN